MDGDAFQNHMCFAAPEVLEGRPCGPAADAWSLGCICIALMSGRYLEPVGNVISVGAAGLTYAIVRER